MHVVSGCFLNYAVHMDVEPCPLQPDLQELSHLRQTSGKNLGPASRENRSAFPFYIHLCQAKGKLVSDGWSLVCTAKVTGCRRVDVGLKEYKYLSDAWVNDTFERGAKKRPKFSPRIGGEDSEERVLWECSHAFVFDEPVMLSADMFPGKQFQPVAKVLQELRPCLVGAKGGWASADQASSLQSGTLPAIWFSGYMFRVPSIVAQKPFSLVTPVSYSKKLRVEPSEASIVAIAAPAATSGSSAPRRFESKEDYYSRGSNWGDPRSVRTPLQEILFAQMAYVLQNFEEAESILSLGARILDPDGSKLQGDLCPVPSKDSLRRSLIKLDLFLMLSRRVFHSPAAPNFHRFLSSGASPQAHRNFFCTIEDVVK